MKTLHWRVHTNEKRKKKRKTKEKHNKRRCIALHCTFLQTCDREQSYRKKAISAFTEQACAYKIENSYKKKEKHNKKVSYSSTLYISPDNSQ